MAESEVTSSVPPRPRPRRLKSDQQAVRDRLVRSFNDFSASTVSTEHIANARDCIRNGGPARDRYQLINFKDILERNEVCMSVCMLVHVCMRACLCMYV